VEEGPISHLCCNQPALFLSFSTVMLGRRYIFLSSLTASKIAVIVPVFEVNKNLEVAKGQELAVTLVAGEVAKLPLQAPRMLRSVGLGGVPLGSRWPLAMALTQEIRQASRRACRPSRYTLLQKKFSLKATDVSSQRNGAVSGGEGFCLTEKR
jgi:hypothetical protein